VHGRPFSLSLTLPPLAALFFKPDPEPPPSLESEEMGEESAEQAEASLSEDDTP